MKAIVTLFQADKKQTIMLLHRAFVIYYMNKAPEKTQTRNLMKQVFKYNETPFKKYQVTENQLIIVMSLNAKKADGKVSED